MCGGAALEEEGGGEGKKKRGSEGKKKAELRVEELECGIH